MATGTRKFHDFCWINVMTKEGERAKAFYAKLFGWSWSEMPGAPGAARIHIGTSQAGALMDLANSQMPPGIPAVIGVMVKVESVDAAVKRIIELGGQSEPAFDILENGRMAMCTDPNGAVFSLWQPKKEGGIDVDSRAHGAPTWFETITSDAARATKFYTSLFGWTTEDQHPVPGMTYTLFKLGGEPIAGLMQRRAEMGNVPPFWGTSFAVKNADETAALAKEIGGTICMPVDTIPGVGRFAMIQSPDGVAFSIMEWK